MRTEVLKYLYDVRLASERILSFIEGKTLQDYDTDVMLRSAVERQFEIIGEAINQMLRIQPDMEPRLTQARQIVAFRNTLIHHYFAISNATVWEVAEQRLPKLHTEVTELLESPAD